MDITITDFLPKYPNIDNTQYPVLNPYENAFENVLFHKKEFYENKLSEIEVFPSEKGELTKYQKTIARFLSSHTPYNGLLLVHSMGTGKTCSAIGAIEQIKSEHSTFTGAIIFGKGDKILDNFITELVEKCTAGQYKDPRYNNLDSSGKLRVSRKKIASFYKLNTFMKFSNEVKDSSDADLALTYSNKIIVIDEVHNLRIQGDSDSQENYRQFHRFLHVVQNCKVLLLSGTPMKDTPQEIASVMNLILPMNDQFPEEENFVLEYMDNIDGSLIIKKEKVNDFKAKLRGKVSFLKESPSNVEKRFIGQKHIAGLKHFITQPLVMHDFQTAYYKEAFHKDEHGKQGLSGLPASELYEIPAVKKKGKAGFYSESKEASLFVFPDGSYGKTGFIKYIEEIKETKLEKELRKKIKKEDKVKKVETGSTFRFASLDGNGLKKLLKPEPDTPYEIILNNIRQCSVCYATVIEKILNTKGNCFVYSISIKGSGAILFSLLLGLFGYSRAYGSEDTPGKRYALIGSGVSSNIATKRTVDRFNKPDNLHGDFIQVIIGGKSASEGLSFKNVIYEAINTPWWNYPEIEQAIARGIRFGSHKDLIEKKINPVVEIHQSIVFPNIDNSASESIQAIMYKTAEDKDISIRRILRLLMESAIDCSINYLRNRRYAEYGSRDCDYEDCDYTCDNIDKEELLKGIDPSKLDVSTYQLYYSNPVFPKIKEKIEDLFKEKNSLSITDLETNLKDTFSEEDVENALIILRDRNINTLEDIRNFNSLLIKNISNNIENMFRTKFILSIFDIMKHFPTNTLFDVLTSLQNLINNNISIIDKYGFHRYLRESNNMFFITDDIGSKPSLFLQTYTQYLPIQDKKTSSDIIFDLKSKSLPSIFLNLVSSFNNEKVFTEQLRLLSNDLKQYILESCIKALYLEKKENIGFREKYIKTFGSTIKVIGDTLYLSFLPGSVRRCFSIQAKQWKDCDTDQSLILHEERKQNIKLLSSKYGVHGAINNNDNKFCIVVGDIDSTLRGTDSRSVPSGKVCGSYNKDELLQILCCSMKEKAPATFLQRFQSRENLIMNINACSNCTKCISINNFKNSGIEVEYSNETLASILYHSSITKEKLCEIIRTRFINEGLIDPTNQICGTSKKGVKVATESARISSGSDTQSMFSVKSKITVGDTKENYDIQVLTNESINPKTLKSFVSSCTKGNYGIYLFDGKLKPEKWFIVFFKNNIYGIAAQTAEGYLTNLIIRQTYYNKEIYPQIIHKIVSQYYSINNTAPVIKINTKIQAEYNLVVQYQVYGFKIISQSDGIILMKFEV